MSKKFVLPIALTLLALGALLYIAFNQNRAADAAISTPTALVQNRVEQAATPTAMPTATLTANRSFGGAKVTGNFLSANQATLAFQMPGRLGKLLVKEGDRVKAGDVLSTLDTSTLDLQIAQAQAAYDLVRATYDKVKGGPTADDVAIAKSNLDRAKAGVDQTQAAYDRAGGQSNSYIAMLPQSLALQQATAAYQAAIAQYKLTVNHPTDTELRTVQAQLAQAQAARDLAKQSLVNATIIAPFDATVVWIGPRVSESVGSSAPVIIVADLAQMQVQANVDEITLVDVQVGRTVTVMVDALGGKMLTGRVKKIGMYAATTGGVVSMPVTIDVDLAGAVVYPGQSALVDFQGTSQ